MSHFTAFCVAPVASGNGSIRYTRNTKCPKTKECSGCSGCSAFAGERAGSIKDKDHGQE